MSKILKRFLVILMILIGAIAVLPKSEKAGLYDEHFDDKVGTVWENRPDFNNNGTKKWYCLEKNISLVGYGEKKVVLQFEYDENKRQYKIKYDMGNGEITLDSSTKEHEILQKIALLAMEDRGNNENTTEYDGRVTPYNNVTQIALWYTLQKLGENGTTDLGQYFGSFNNENDEANNHILKTGTYAWQAGDAAMYIEASGSRVISGEIKSTVAYRLYRRINDVQQIISPKYKKILMAIYSHGDYQNLICVDFEPDEPEPTPFEFELKKVDESGKGLNGAKFDVEITGVKNVTVDGKDYSSYKQNITVDGTKKFTNIEQDPNANYITVTVQETSAPSDDYEIDETIHTKYFRYNNDEWQSWENGAWTKYNGYSFTLQVVNKLQRKIDIGGYVFLDGQSGDKSVSKPNGKYDGSDKKVEGVKVELWVKRGTNSSYSMEKSTNTDRNGAYKFNIDNGQNVKDYMIRFKYNGAEYEDTIYYQNLLGRDKNLPNVSKAKEDNNIRNTFNSRFSEVKLNKTVQDGYLIDYGNWTRTSSQIGTSKLNISMEGIGQVNGGDYYQMYADTEAYTESRDDLNFGIKERGMDLALTMQVDHTDVSINGKTTTYDYTDININTNEELEKWLNSVLADNKVNVDVYPTDYYYRITDYIKDGVLNKDEELTKDLGKTVQDELDVKITYKVRMFNQTAGIDAHIKELVYYYNENAYTLNSVVDGAGNSYNWSNAGSEYGTISGYNRIIISGDWNISNDEQYLYLTFTLNKDNGQVKLGEVNGNIVAITSYSTADGLLDNDSSTRSIVDGKEIQYEDDTARAENVNITLSNKVRKISGNVFNGLDKTAIDDVVVQLIEITKNNNEYIWQETKAGSNNVTSLVRLEEGDLSAYNYNNTVSETGKYEFLNVAPGNYIVRFIYGDGYNYDITLNNTKYNGADYKSTIDPNYKEEWYNTTNYFGTGASVARDNEARRLEVMMTTNTIDSGLGTALDVYAKNRNSITSVEKTNILNYLAKLNERNDNEFNAAINYLKTLKGNNDSWNTWKNNVLSNISDDDLLVLVKKFVAYKTFMAAETSKVNVPIDVNNSNALKTNSSNTTVTTTRNNYNIINYDTIEVNFANVNFGITLRPQVKLELEKHITALKVTPNGTGVKEVVNAKANIQNIVNGEVVDTTGEQKGLTKIKSTRDERGYWKVETDVELDQGANLEVEYTYVVKNVGDEDYISRDLVDLYTSNSGEYSENLKKNVIDGLKSTIKGKTHMYGSALGEYYYTGIPGASDAKVVSKVELFGEALNNQLRYDGEISGSDFKKANTEKVNKTIYDTNAVGKTEEIETVLETVAPSSPLTRGQADVSKKIKLTRVLASLNSDDNGNIPSYIAEVLKYSSASGARNIESIPGNLSYVHSKDKEMTLNNSYTYEVNGEKYEAQDINSMPEGATNVRKANESDEFWGETIMISKKTGENKILPVQIGIAVAVSVAVIGVGIVLIRKIVLTK